MKLLRKRVGKTKIEHETNKSDNPAVFNQLMKEKEDNETNMKQKCMLRD